jgi:hypothetical protein
MRFPQPTAVTCPACGQPTVVAETSLGPERVHCGTWRWNCDPLGSGTEYRERPAVTPVSLRAPDTLGDQKSAA